MFKCVKKRIIIYGLVLMFILTTCVFSVFYSINVKSAFAMPFYCLQPKNIVLRSRFKTSFSSSSEERKNNIKLASLSLDKVFIDVGAEFSFNKTVGPRTEKRGYKNSKIIVGGEFVEGVGGGVCQVSTTLYNAVLLSGLKVVEYHPHSLVVSYVSPSFDAMVSYGFADLRFINNTNNPIILHTIVTDNTLTIEIYGEPNEFTYVMQSIKVEEIPAPKELEVIDDKGEYPELFQGQKKVIKYSKAGLKSQGYIFTYKNGKLISTKKLRSDTYSATRGLIVYGTKPEVIDTPQQNNKIEENAS